MGFVDKQHIPSSSALPRSCPPPAPPPFPLPTLPPNTHTSINLHLGIAVQVREVVDGKSTLQCLNNGQLKIGQVHSACVATQTQWRLQKPAQRPTYWCSAMDVTAVTVHARVFHLSPVSWTWRDHSTLHPTLSHTPYQKKLSHPSHPHNPITNLQGEDDEIVQPILDCWHGSQMRQEQT